MFQNLRLVAIVCALLIQGCCSCSELESKMRANQFRIDGEVSELKGNVDGLSMRLEKLELPK